MESERRKLFVGGVSQGTSEETLREHFSKYGEVIDSEIIRDRITGNGRGFGFVTLADLSVVATALQDEHIILGRKVEVKVAKPKGEQLSNKKIFVGGLPPNLTVEELKEYFERFGEIADGVVICDKESKKSRGFGFITFVSKNVVYNVLQKNYYPLKDKFVEVKKAKPKDRISGPMYTNDSNTGLGSGSSGLQLPNVHWSAYMPSYGSVSGYPYETAYETYSNFVPSSYYWNALPYGNSYLYPTYTRLMGVTNGYNGYHANPTFNSGAENYGNVANGTNGYNSYHANLTFNNGAENYSKITAANSNSDIELRTNHGDENIGIVDGNSSENNEISSASGENAEIPPVANGKSGEFSSEKDEADHAALLSDKDEAEHQKRVDCPSTPCKSS